MRGLTGLGAYLIHQMIKQHLIIQLDHMDSKTADRRAVDRRVASTTPASCPPTAAPRRSCSSGSMRLGGFVNPPAQPTRRWSAIWKMDKALSSPKYTFGFGWGSDENGLAEQPGPSGTPISYPFKSYDGRVTFTQEQWGSAGSTSTPTGWPTTACTPTGCTSSS